MSTVWGHHPVFETAEIEKLTARYAEGVFGDEHGLRRIKRKTIPQPTRHSGENRNPVVLKLFKTTKTTLYL